MARASTALLLAFLSLALAAPASAAGGLPAPLGQTERVTSWYWQQGNGGCNPYDPVVGVANTGFLSEVTHEAVDGGTRYDLHLESLVPAPGCPTLDLSFVSTLAAWPSGYSSSAPLTSACGATGYLVVYTYPEGHHMQVFIDLPAACGAPVTGWLWLGASVQPLHPSDYMACVPVDLLVGSCVGAGEQEHPAYQCRDGQHYASTYVTPVVFIDRRCDWQTGETMVVVSPVVGVVWVEARASSCTVVVQDPLLGAVDQRAPCPEEVRALLYEGDWGHVLP